MTEAQIIVSIGGEGGSIDLYGYRDATNGWRFCRGVNDQTPAILPEGEYGGRTSNHSSAWVTGWDEGLQLLDRYPWARLTGLAVHPIFRQRAWTAVQQRLENAHGPGVGRAREAWARLCGQAAGAP